MQKLIRPVGVAFRAEHAADHHLGLRKALLQQAHQRDRAALADIAERRAVVGLRGVGERCFKPRRQGRRIPAGGTGSAGPAIGAEGDFGVVGGVVFEQGFELLCGDMAFDQRG